MDRSSKSAPVDAATAATTLGGWSLLLERVLKREGAGALVGEQVEHRA
ncbi:MAG: hypothetical protein IPM00_04245 [Tetrasphaera sp.]|nr:hypothetical protein [Tetrasphaera sp.]